MDLSERAYAELTRLLGRLQSRMFNEDDILLLLIYWRPHFPEGTLIWELACFMAHPEARDRGIFHKELDSRYAKMVYGNTIGGPFNKKLDPMSIEAKLFKVLIEAGIETCDESFLTEKTGLNKNQAIAEMRRSYQKNNGVFELKDNPNINKLNGIFGVLLGMMNMRASIINSDIINETNNAIRDTCSNLGINEFELDDESAIEYLVCITCLLHSRHFTLFDNNKGQCNLDVRQDHNDQINLTLYAKVLNIQWPLMQIENLSPDYIEPTIKTNDNFNPKDVGFYAVRNEEQVLTIANEKK